MTQVLANNAAMNTGRFQAIYDLDSIKWEELIALADKLQSGTIPKGEGRLVLTDEDGEVEKACCLGVYTLMCKDRLGLTQELEEDEDEPGQLILKFFGPTGTGENSMLLPEVQNYVGVTKKDIALPIIDDDGFIDWQDASQVNDKGTSDMGPDDSFMVSIVPAFRLLAQMARDYQEGRMYLHNSQPFGYGGYEVKYQ